MEQFWSVLFFIAHIILFSITKTVYFELKKIFEILQKKHTKRFYLLSLMCGASFANIFLKMLILIVKLILREVKKKV